MASRHGPCNVAVEQESGMLLPRSTLSIAPHHRHSWDYVALGAAPTDTHRVPEAYSHSSRFGVVGREMHSGVALEGDMQRGTRTTGIVRYMKVVSGA